MTEGPGSKEWRDAARERLLTFARRSVRDEGGFVWLDDDGDPDPDMNLELWINARMTYVFALAHLAGDPSTGSGDGEYLRLVTHGVEAMALFHDDKHGGWFAQIDEHNHPVGDNKLCYEHAFVLLAACAASAAGAEGADALLTEATDIHHRMFWDSEAGRCVEQRSRDWSTIDAYRGANSNMHTVEAYLFAADATGNPIWRDRALSICERIIGIHARAHDWRIPEHYDSDWTPLPDYNQDQPADPFRPFGATPGHAFEWSRLLVHLAAALDDPRPWVEEAAEELFARAVDDAVSDEFPGIPYTTDWHGVPVVEERFHWVISEAVLAASALHDYTGQALYEGFTARWWSEIAEYFVDEATGSWHHELSPTMGPSTRTWHGKPDAYHAYNALTLPDLPLAPSAALTIRDR
jgi:mannose/cellobiose epimerase-like protein (N-acyl-D-glucosamine 2-epimerase family)